MRRKNLNGTNIYFTQDEKIYLEEESHTYTVSGIPQGGYEFNANYSHIHPIFISKIRIFAKTSLNWI